jgi:hypothetical protein
MSLLYRPIGMTAVGHFARFARSETKSARRDEAVEGHEITLEEQAFLAGPEGEFRGT